MSIAHSCIRAKSGAPGRWRRSFALIAFPLTLACQSAATPETGRGSQESVQELSSRAAQAERRGDYAVAAAAYKRIVDLRPDLTSARVNLGLMRYLAREYAEAANDFQAVLRSEPGAFVPNLFLGLTLLRLQRPAEAIPHLRRAEEGNARDPQVLLALGQAYVVLRDYEQANAAYLRAVGVSPASADAWYGLGITYLELERALLEHLKATSKESQYGRLLLAEALLQQGRYREAVKAWRGMDAVWPPLPCVHAGLGFALMGLGDLNGAASAFQQEDRSCLPGRLGSAAVSATTGDYVSSIRDIQLAWSSDRDFTRRQLSEVLRRMNAEVKRRFSAWLRTQAAEIEPEVKELTLAGLERSSMGDPAIAEVAEFKRGGASRESPGSLLSQGRYAACEDALVTRLNLLAHADLRMLARCAFFRGDHPVAFAAAGRLQDLSKSDAEALYWRSKSAGALAINAFLRASAADPNSPKAHLVLGDFYRQKQDFREAESEYRKALDLDPRSFPAHFGLAAGYFQDAQFDRAFDEAQKAFAINGGDLETRFILGGVLASRGDLKAAKPHLEAVVKANRGDLSRAHALLARVYTNEGRLKEALAELRQAIDSDPDGSYHYQLFRLYQKLGNEAAARTALKKYNEIREARAVSVSAMEDYSEPGDRQQARKAVGHILEK